MLHFLLQCSIFDSFCICVFCSVLVIFLQPVECLRLDVPDTLCLCLMLKQETAHLSQPLLSLPHLFNCELQKVVPESGTNNAHTQLWKASGQMTQKRLTLFSSRASAASTALTSPNLLSDSTEAISFSMSVVGVNLAANAAVDDGTTSSF
jgi:hypothetical protein